MSVIMLNIYSIMVPEYYVYGHDDAKSLYDGCLSSHPDTAVSLCFAGLGDARHLYAT